MSVKLLTLLTTYVLIVLCELGDKTQVAVLLLTSNNPPKRWLIFTAGAIALVLCVAIEVSVGAMLARYIGPAIINRATGVIFLIVGAITLIGHFRVLEKLKLKKSAQPSDASTIS
ncbi:MAG: TMEM165/GDT1 family protein [Bacillota bacterium]